MIGVFGGTFDPVHYGHLRSALEVANALNLRQVRLIPCSQPVHRAQPVALSTMRLAMLKLAVAHQVNLMVDDREINRPGPSYMIDTLASLKEEYTEEPLLLMLGSDSFKYLHKWERWQQLFDYAHMVVITRPSYTVQQLDDFLLARVTDKRADLSQLQAGKLYFQQVTQLNISATAIRALVAAHQDPSFLLPDAIINYIKQHKLYTKLN
ncbi:MAG: nicotinate-nucleotide adenylyltransferase [Methylococcaceae bacterium]|jgi:nicotinate-nucleotide adenylyltransferase